VGKTFPPAGRNAAAPATFGDRLKFVIWLAAYRLGVDSGKELAEAIGVGGTQLSKWANENPCPSFPSIRKVAEAVGVSASWLDDPRAPDAREPEMFAEWWAARQRRAAQLRRA
jgi:transcriptional regulator with XRE-family HTH domain